MKLQSVDLDELNAKHSQLELFARRLAYVTALVFRVAMVVVAFAAVPAAVWPSFRDVADAVLPGLGLSIVVVGALSALLQVFDWVEGSRLFGVSGSAHQWLAHLVYGSVIRRSRRRLFGMYGRDVVAQALLTPEESMSYSVASQRRRATVRKLVCASIIAAFATAVSIEFLVVDRADLKHEVGELFTLSDDFRVSVVSSPSCRDATGDTVDGICTLDVRFENNTHSDVSYGPGSFGSDRYYDSDYGEFYVVLVSGEDEYPYFGLNSSQELRPNQTAVSTLEFDVPQGVAVDSLAISSGSGDLHIVRLTR